jgi:tetratricopeptide (TPR) repeat protein
MMAGFLAENPQDPYVCSKLGALYIQMGDRDEGIELLQRGLQANKIDPHTHYELLYHLGCTLGGTLESVDYYQQALQQPIAPKLKLGAMHNLGTLRQEAGDIQAAQSLYEQVLAIDPNFAITHCHLGMVLKQQGKMADAMNHYRQAIDLKPSYSEAYQNLGVVLLKMGDVSNSLLAFGRSIELHRQQGNETEATRLQTTLQEMGFRIG